MSTGDVVLIAAIILTWLAVRRTPPDPELAPAPPLLWDVLSRFVLWFVIGIFGFVVLMIWLTLID